MSLCSFRPVLHRKPIAAQIPAVAQSPAHIPLALALSLLCHTLDTLHLVSYTLHLSPSTEKPPVTKRLPKAPRDGFTLENVKMETITAIPYDIVKEGLQ